MKENRKPGHHDITDSSDTP